MNAAAGFQRAIEVLEARGARATADELRESVRLVTELLEADREHDAAREHLASVNRHIAEKGWLDIEFDALREACARFVEAQFRRNAALARFEVQP